MVECTCKITLPGLPGQGIACYQGYADCEGHLNESIWTAKTSFNPAMIKLQSSHQMGRVQTALVCCRLSHKPFRSSATVLSGTILTKSCSCPHMLPPRGGLGRRPA